MTLISDGLVGTEATASSTEITQNPDELYQTVGQVVTDEFIEAEVQSTMTPRLVYEKIRDPETYDVIIDSKVRLEDYESVVPAEDIAWARALAQPLAGKNVMFINPTLDGGGVAMLRPPLINLLRELGVDAHWFVMAPDEAAFKVTKKIHNISQRVAAEEDRLRDADKAIHQDWTKRNAEVLAESMTRADVIVIDDPQPTGLIKYIKELNPSAKIVFRNHIQTNRERMADPNSAQGEVWAYQHDECGVNLVDAYVAHPVADFVPAEMDDRLFYAPATVDYPHEDLVRTLSQKEIDDGLNFIDQHLVESGQQPLDRHRRRVALVARFDPSKGMDLAMEIYAAARQKILAKGLTAEELPELMIVGNGSVDDPDGAWMQPTMMHLREEKYADFKDDIKVVRLAHSYVAMNALMHVCDVGLQTSTKEGLETRITDWIMHGKPVIINKRGGMPLQVVDHESGFIVDPDAPDYIDQASNHLVDLFTRPEEYARMSQRASELAVGFNNREFGTVANVSRWLRVFNSVLFDTVPKGDRHWQISELNKN